MSRRDDDALPDDLQALTERLDADRVRPTPLELDGLYDRARRQAVRPARAGRGSLGRLVRLNGVTAFLTAALILTTGTSAVIAATTATDSTLSTSITAPADAGECQYHDAYSATYTGTSTKGLSSATITISVNCRGDKICIESSKGISNYQFSNAAKRENFGDPVKICIDIPAGATYIRVKAGTTDHIFYFPA